VTDHVRFHGETDERTMLRCYQQSDLFVLPNRQVGSEIEGFGIVLLEAQSCGRAVIAGDSGGTSETLENRKTGLIVDCTTTPPLAHAVTALLSDADRREAMGRAARTWAGSQFAWSSLAAQALERMTQRRV